MAGIRIKRGTRAQLDAAAAANDLSMGEPYLITDEARIAVGLTVSTYQDYVLPGEPAPMAADGLIDGYRLARVDEPAASGALVVPLDGRVYDLTLAGDVTLSATIPVSAAAGDAIVRVHPAASGGPWGVAFPASYRQPDGVAVAVAPATAEIAECVLTHYKDGSFGVRSQTMSVPT